ncbi:flagellar protein FliS [Paracoccaceae bacterium]|nr:flagellar protein FliS [Paracoccaceae bacterium]
MSLDQAANLYKQTENFYIKGIDSPHGRVQILFDQLEINLEKVIIKHPKTDFVSYGKVRQCFSILANSLDHEKGGELAEQLVELYDYCARTANKYLIEKDVKKLEEVLSLVSDISDAWKSITPK